MARGSQLVACVVLVSLVLSGCAGGGTSNVAQVGGEAITDSALEHWVGVEKEILGGLAVDKRAVLGRLIGFHWVLAEAAEYGLRIAGSEVQKQLALLQYARKSGASSGLFTPEEELQLFADEGDLQKLLASSMLSNADRVWLVSLQMLISRIQQRLVAGVESSISQQRIASFYHANRQSFVVPEKRDIEVFMTKDWATAARGKREVQAGQSFHSVASRLNIATEAEHGLIMGLASNLGEQLILDHFFGAKPHVLMGPVQQALVYVFRVARVFPSYLRPLPAVAATIRRTLATREATEVLRPALKMRWRARTACGSGYVVEQCGDHSAAAHSG